MFGLLSIPVVRNWIEASKKRHSASVFGEIKFSVVWTDKKDECGHLLVPVDPINLVAQINASPFILLNSHDPGKPLGQVIECASFESKDGENFIVAALGFYAGGENLEFRKLNIDISEVVSPPGELPALTNGVWIDFAVDPREVDSEWSEEVTCNAPIKIRSIELSHNSAEVIQELIRVGLPYLAIVWNPFVTAIASEAGKNTYVAISKWVRQLLEKLEKRQSPILSLQSHQQDCQVSFLFRGKDIKLNYAAHDALSNAAAQAALIINKLKIREMPARELIYEFDKDTLRWYPSYAILNDNRIVTDSSKLIAIEQLPPELSLGISID
ncbi:hypothetical protein CMV60_05715 [Serratia marcescens]|nr:hypothetical protein CMV60_05715 [Serratia marcescens]